MNSICLISMPFFLNLYFQAPKHPLAHVSIQIRTKPRTPSLMALIFCVPDTNVVNLKLRVTIATNPGICFRKSVLPQARKMRFAPSAMRFIITFSMCVKAVKVHLTEIHLGCKVSFLDSKSSDDYHSM